MTFRNILSLSLLVCMAFAFGSCAFHSGITTSNTAITNGNFQVIGTSYGYSKSTHVLGIGGLKRRAMTFEARQDMECRFPLKPNEAYANVTTDYKRSFFPIVNTTKCYVTADIIRFEAPQDVQQLTDRPTSDKITFKENDLIQVFSFKNERTQNASIISLKEDNYVQVIFNNLSFGSLRKFNPSFPPPNEIFYFHYTPNWYTGDVEIGDRIQSLWNETALEVVGLSEDFYFVKSENGEFRVFLRNQDYKVLPASPEGGDLDLR